MHGVAGMKKKRRRAGAGERRSDLASDQAGLAQTGHHNFATTVAQQLHGPDKVFVQPRDHGENPIGLDPQYVSRAFENFRCFHCAPPSDVFTKRSSCLTTVSKPSKSFSLREFGPSLNA